MNVKTKTTEKWQLSCCALAQLTAQDWTPISELQTQIDRMKEEAKKSWHTGIRQSGERSCFTIVSPGEDRLRANLIELGFQKIWTFPRRNGYPAGILEMFALSW